MTLESTPGPSPLLLWLCSPALLPGACELNSFAPPSCSEVSILDPAGRELNPLQTWPKVPLSGYCAQLWESWIIKTNGTKSGVLVWLGLNVWLLPLKLACGRSLEIQARKFLRSRKQSLMSNSGQSTEDWNADRSTENKHQDLEESAGNRDPLSLSGSRVLTGQETCPAGFQCFAHHLCYFSRGLNGGCRILHLLGRISKQPRVCGLSNSWYF